MSMNGEMSQFRAEIGEQPEVAARLLQRGSSTTEAIARAIRKADPAGIVIAARGSSDHAALYAKYLFQHRNRLLVSMAAPSLFTNYRTTPRLDRFCVIGISQSGASPDVAAVVEEARRQGAVTVAVSNDADSALGCTADYVLPLEAGVERSVPASKTYTASLLALAMLSEALDREAGFAAALARVPDALESALVAEREVTALAPWLARGRSPTSCMGQSRSPNLPCPR